ncbi:MAG: DUF763 domain-containing protein [Candidatus Micrarchaeota archaeon]|nr:DUF763 domain-containing protein [Candidatus Micrarchaeota archaeon]
MRQITELPLHGGRAPKWLFHRMVRLSRAISLVIIDDFGADELARRLSDTNWFQALSCAIGYDWHSSGTTTVTVGALKEALNDTGEIFVAGGKGKAGTNTPNDIREGTGVLGITNSEASLVETSRLSAKIDSSLVYDNIGIYQHSLIFTKTGKWSVVQQAIDSKRDTAIRFQWWCDAVTKKDIANEPHTGISTDLRSVSMDLTAEQNAEVRNFSVNAVEDYAKAIKYPDRHKILADIDLTKRGREALGRASELEPRDYRELLLVKGVGRSTLRSLALISSLVYGKEIAYRDPITYAYNVGGKDGIPFPVDKRTYDSVCESLEDIIDKARIDRDEKYHVLRRLNAHVSGGVLT